VSGLFFYSEDGDDITLRMLVFNGLQGVMSQRREDFIVTDMRTSNHAQLSV
jgi:hypothetical protein